MSSVLRCFVVIGLLVALVDVSDAATDECLRAVTLDGSKRDPKSDFNSQDSAICDAFIDGGTWYRFSSGDRLGQLPEYCVAVLHCGTHAPIWMNGSHPTGNNPEPVKRTVCAQYWQGGDCCTWSGQVSVKWCRNSTTGQEYYIYQLERPPVCSMAYCVNTTSQNTRTQLPAALCSEQCAWNNVISQCSCPKYPAMTDPVVSRPYISDSKQVTGVDGRPFNATKFSLRCTVGYPKQIADDGARFRVSFYVDGKVNKTLQVTSTNPTAVIDESDLGKLGVYVSCSVSSFWISSNPVESARRSSNAVFVGIIPIDNSSNQINRIDMIENQEYSFRMTTTFPITSAECFNRPNVPCEAKYRFSVSANTQTFLGDCSFYFTPSKTVSDVIKVRPIPTVGTRVTPFYWQLDFDRQINYSNSLYCGYKIQSIPVTIRDLTPRPMCSSTGDPHITTFGTPNNPKKTYNMYLVGDFVLVNYTQRALEIQVRQFPCNGGAVTCNCGVMIREGNNILGVDSCPRSANPLDWTPRIIQTLGDQASHGMTISQTGSGWTINLISGIQVNVDRFQNGVLDIHVIGLAVEFSNYNGLCSYNGNQNDHCTTDCEKYRVQKSFFGCRLQDLPQCVSESYTSPTCDCTGGRNADNSIGVGCTDFSKSIKILGPFYSCRISRRKRSAPQPSGYPIDLDSLCNNYYPTLQLKSQQPFKEANRQVAIKKCTDALTSSAIYQTCHGLQNMDETSLINSCATDYQISGDLNVTNAIKTQLERSCVHAIESSITETSNGSDPNTIRLKDKLQEVKAKICPQQCSQHGSCSNGVCQCSSGYVGKDCSLMQDQVPVIVNILNPLCDVRRQSCDKVFLEAADISSTPSCKLRSNSGQVLYDAAPDVSGGVVICSFPSLTSTETLDASLSNDDGSSFSNEERISFTTSTPTTLSTTTTTPRTTTRTTTVAATTASTSKITSSSTTKTTTSTSRATSSPSIRTTSSTTVTSKANSPLCPAMTNPVVSRPYISDSKQVTGVDGRPFTATKFSLRCTVGYPKQIVDDGARFRVSFYVDGKVNKTLLVTSTNPTAVIDESDLGKLGVYVSCSVSSFWISLYPVESARLSSNAVFVGIILIDNSSNQINRIDMIENQEYSFRLMATFPITSTECFNRPNVPCEARYTFSISANTQLLMSDCSFYFTPSKTISDVIKVRPIPTVGIRVTPFNWQLDFDRQINYCNSLYCGYKIQSILVTIRDLTPRPMCSSTGDPHITTFGTLNTPKKTYNTYLMGDFVLVNYTQRAFEIQVRQFPCNGGAVTCICAVMIREGNNILGIDTCPRSANPLDWTPRIMQILSDQANRGMTISQTETGWTINLISGIRVNVDRGFANNVLDVHVIGLAVEFSNYNGLCSYNGYQIDHCTTDCEKYRVQKSFFEYRPRDIPQCVSESYTSPTCDCTGGRNADNSIGVGCTDVSNSIEILGPFYSCKEFGNMISAPVRLDNPIDLDSLCNNYYPKLQLKSQQTFREGKRQVAIKKCTDALTSSAIYQTCHGLQNMDETPLINSCATDYQISGDLSVTNSIEAQLERFCVHAIESSIIEAGNGSDPNARRLKDKLKEVKAKICPKQCSQHGRCSNGVCQCSSGHSGKDCSSRQGQAPVIVKILNPLCDVRRKSCGKVFLEAADISSTMSCKLRSNRGQVWYDASPDVSGGVVICSFPSLTSVGTYFMSLSNAGSAYSFEETFDLCDSGTG